MIKMLIRSARFIKSSPTLKECPADSRPEFGFIGRSNVGKSSLINMLTGWYRLAKTSGHPGKTRTINHFLINDSWYLVDLPGYGYARVAARSREDWMRAVLDYINNRENLISLFVLLDSRLSPQKSDIEFMDFLGENQVPFARVFTKTDKLSLSALKNSVKMHDTEMFKKWETLPVTFFSSVKNKSGREEILNYIEESINNLSNNF